MEAAPLLLSSLERKEEVTAEVKRIILAWFLITVTMVANSIADFGWSSNLIAFFINELNAGTIFATQINYVILGLDNFFVILGYIAADSFPSLVSVVTVSAFISFLGTIMLTITSSIKLSSNLYSWGAVFISMTLASLGGGCTRFTIESLGVGQFDREHNHLASTMIVLNRYTSFLIAAALSFLVIVYIDDNVSWCLGFGICAIANAIALVVFLSGKRFYRQTKQDGGPITSIPRVLRRILLWSEHFLEENCYLGDNTTKVQKFRFMVTKWRQLFTVEEAEDLKTLIKTMPLWPSDMVLLACISMLKGLSVLQARAIGNWNSNSSGNTNLTLSPGSYAYISQEAIVWTLMIAVWPCLSYAPKATWRHPLRLIATSHVCVIIAIVFSALIEPGIRDFVGSSAETASAWLIIQLAISGSGLCFYMVGQSILYTVEFPSSALTVSTSMYALFSGFGYLLSAVITGLLPAFTGWLPDDINHGRLDYVFWMLAVLAVLNFAYFQFCTANYKHPLADLDEEYHDAFVNKFILSRVLS
ncbi:protein NRT1/ PTR FAMILY 2.3-like isoform X1 [Mercurialis annua]|uniref:protein NRT1/ PTR FAMILY 2.3-like isoform X1 n=1 Tax=Mercurialis annua TaxID=3986 RepID=UPI00215EFEDA|nr:protein NRT1/ PTR FAMILY 2.3-like isoform X1 [Mercurialis annua]